MDQAKKKRIIQRIILIAIALVVVGLIVFFISDVFIPFIKLEIKNDYEGAKALLLSKGFIGFITVSVVEGLQMVVVFISAEFIQITSGMSYPWWLAIILCDTGVMIGSSIIYMLVNVFKFDDDLIMKNKGITKYTKMAKTKSTIIIMYLLFIMPIIPFGAICYYGASKKIPYFRYLLTCATGVIPSIVTSIIMGAAIKEFISKSLPLWALILIIVSAAAVLFALLAFVLKKFFFKPGNGKQRPVLISILEKLSNFYGKLHSKIKVTGRESLEDIESPFVLLSNHHSLFDIMSLSRVFGGMNVVAVCNEHLFGIPVIGKLLDKAGHIRKKMYYNDLNCIKEIFKAVKSGYPVALFPEARLSADGGPSPIDESIAHLCQKLGVPVIITQVKNSYFVKPKWRKKVFRHPVEVEIKRVITKEELQNLSQQEIYSIITENLSYNAFSNENIKIKNKHKAEGLDGLLYMCPHCRSLYSNVSEGNTLTCTSCGKKYTIAENYQFEGEDIKNIFEYYAKIKECELEQLNETKFEIPVDVKIFRYGVKKYRPEKGIFKLDGEKLSFKSDVSDLYFEFKIEDKEAIAYSVNEEFELYYNDELYYFYPENGKECTRVSLVFELLKERDYEEQRKQTC